MKSILNLMRSRRMLLFTLGAMFSASNLIAHPGHSLNEATALHIVTSPYHLSVLTMIGCGLIIASRFVQKQMPRRAMALAGSLALVATVLMWKLNS